jgi:putative ABC transport system permease protein
MQNTWEKINPGFPFEYKFLDASYDELYISEDRLGKIFKYFSILTILISCLGLFGLAAFMAEQRTKEIGIRRVFGADISQIFFTLSGNFLKWVVVANIIAWPVTYYIMSRWLEGYVYHARLSPWIFILAATISLIIAIITVSFQTLKAAYRAPIDALKYE